MAVAATVALSMIGAPVLAHSAALLSVVTSVERSGATLGHANDLRRDHVVALAFFAVVIAAIFLIGDNDGGDLPASA